MSVRVCGMTDTGKEREINQDLFDFAVFGNGIGCAVVCDGMGGAAAGERASFIAMGSVMEVLKEKCSAVKIGDSDIRKAIRTAIFKANSDVNSAANADFNNLGGMGTTVAAAVVNGRVLHISHVGDSRIYSFYNGALSRLTKDHSLVSDMVQTGLITEEEAAVHPERNILTRVVGVAKQVEEDYKCIVITENETLLLCTDGLYNYVTEEQITDIMTRSSFDNIPARLVDAANEAGGGDNITAVIIRSEV